MAPEHGEQVMPEKDGKKTVASGSVEGQQVIAFPANAGYLSHRLMQGGSATLEFGFTCLARNWISVGQKKAEKSLCSAVSHSSKP